jgi:DNA-binding MarR family transcriptional regulator
LRVMRKPLRSLGLTAARFDILYALKGDGDQTRFRKTQSELRRCLGVCASVVSRMLASLEKLGWVNRRRDEHGIDRRQVWVRLTEAGLSCMTKAFKMLRRASWRLVHEAICFGRHRDRSAQFVRTERLEGYLSGMRQHYGDAATLFYPWHPDD